MLNIAIAVVACISIHEILVATKFINNRSVVISSFLFTAFLQFIPAFPEAQWMRLIALSSVVYFMVLFITLLASHNKMNVERIGLAMMVTAMIAFPFYSMNYMYWKSPYDGDARYRLVGQALVIGCFLISWMTDTFAYFTGMLFGKHKMAPTISPKKTWEGAIGGFIGCVLSVCLIAYLCTNTFQISNLEVNFVNLIIVTMISSVVSMIGDLSFSIIKRCFDIKDFGNIMPGHGGVLDRFDSVIFVCPVVCIMNIYMPIIIK